MLWRFLFVLPKHTQVLGALPVLKVSCGVQSWSVSVIGGWYMPLSYTNAMGFCSPASYYTKATKRVTSSVCDFNVVAELGRALLLFVLLVTLYSDFSPQSSSSSSRFRYGPLCRACNALKGSSGCNTGGTSTLYLCFTLLHWDCLLFWCHGNHRLSCDWWVLYSRTFKRLVCKRTVGIIHKIKNHSLKSYIMYIYRLELL